MRLHDSISMRTAALFAALAIFALPVAATAQNAKPSNWKLPRTSDGQPDLQGNWTNSTLTPLERPAQYGNKGSLTEAEAKQEEQQEAARNEKAGQPTDPKLGIQDLPTSCGRGFTGLNCGYNTFWIDPGTQILNINGEYRTSILVEPANGRTPALTPEAQAKMAARFARLRAQNDGSGGSEGPESRSLGERCLMSFGPNAGPPMLPSLYNNNYQIVQSKDSVMILVEMVHDARIVRIGGKHRPENIRTWMGDTIGHWEGDTLVAETINMRAEQFMRGGSDRMKVTERFTRIGPDRILYRFTVEDPATYVQPYTGELTLNAMTDQLYEYACHEGNYALPGILKGEREKEKMAAEAKK